MVTVRNTDLDLKKIAESGQCFRMNGYPGREDTWQVLAQSRRVIAIQKREHEVVFDCPDEEFQGFWKDYFDLDTDYSAFRKAIDPCDGFLTAAAAEGRGIRILRQDPWEMLITFIISQRKSIPAIKAAVEAICSRWGEPVGEAPGVFAFPMAEALACAKEEELRACSLGYRVPYIMKASRLVSEGLIDLAALNGLDDEALLEALMQVPGVGPKVGNCVSLFAYHRIGAFPVDVWIGRMTDQHYGGRFPVEKYEGFAGVMQQYMFYHALKSKK